MTCAVVSHRTSAPAALGDLDPLLAHLVEPGREEETFVLTWTVICAGATGLLMGLLLLRVPAVLAATVVAVIAGIVLTSLTR